MLFSGSFAQHSFVSSVTDSKPLREIIAEAKAEVTEEIEEHKEEEEEEDTEAHLVSKLYQTQSARGIHTVVRKCQQLGFFK